MGDVRGRVGRSGHILPPVPRSLFPPQPLLSITLGQKLFYGPFRRLGSALLFCSLARSATSDAPLLIVLAQSPEFVAKELALVLSVTRASVLYGVLW